MELRHLRYFVAVARLQNFTRAAAQLNMAQPPLSRQIRHLEEEIGLPLIARGSRPVQLTAAGRVIYEQAVQVLERIDQLYATARRLGDAERHLFRIGFVASTLYGELPAMVRRFRAARPDLEVTLLEMMTLEQVAALKEGRIDVGFGRIPFEDAAITRHLLRNERLVAALPATHPALADIEAIHLQDLARNTLIVYPRAPRPSYADQVLAVFRERNLKPDSVIEVRELQTALGLVAADAGICLVPASVQSLRRDNVEYRTLAEPDVTSPNIMICRKDDSSPEIAIVLELVQAIYKEQEINFGA